MLGIRLNAEADARLTRHAKEAGRPKSVIVRDWIMEKLDEKEVDELIRRATQVHATRPTDRQRALALSAAHLRWLDQEDGGYDWGPTGPPTPL